MRFQPIAQLDAGDLTTFQRDYLAHNKPVILKGLSKSWPAASRWSLEYFKKQFGDTQVTVTTPNRTLFAQDAQQHERALQEYVTERLPLSSYIEHLETTPETKKYLEALGIKKVLPALWDDIRMPSYIPEKSLLVSTMWLGPKGTRTPLHYDVPQNTLVQLVGRKELTLISPDEVFSLYPVSWLSRQYPLSSKVNLTAPDLATFPKFAKVTAYKGVIEPGDGIFLPGCWWHEVYNLDITVAVNFWWKPSFKTWLDPAFFYLGLRGVSTHVLKMIRGAMTRKQPQPATT